MGEGSEGRSLSGHTDRWADLPGKRAKYMMGGWRVEEEFGEVGGPAWYPALKIRVQEGRVLA